ncbi:MFS transporter [Baekduia sp. Peel2402]|uniref:MFS transporter n=1 Tax=Baekduia sp. Peel2402 TaxID=3458296 RepID=UPI00403E5E9B
MAGARGDGGGFAPLRHATFRRLWIAQFTSNVGGWMQTVGAQWLMLSLSGSAAYLAFIQSAASLPVLLFAIPAGALADLVDRRKLLMWSTTFMIFASVLLAALTLADLVTPWVLLALLFAVGAGQAWTSPAWQSLQPELVPTEERPQAIALGSVNQNLARAAGPAIGGVVVALTEPSVTFLVNAASFVAVVFTLWRWRTAPRPAASSSSLPREHVVAAMRASGRYVRNSPALRTVLGRAAAFMVCASALWALLPAIANGPLGLGSGGYGLLLGCVGVGAVGGAIALPRLRARWAPDPTLAVGSLLVAASAFVLAEVHVVGIAAVALVVAGCGWIVALATLNSSYQALLPGWIKARGLSYYLIVFQGGTAIGSAIMGILAGWLGVTEVLAGAAVALALTPLLSLVTTIRRFEPDELLPAGGEPAPHVLTAADAESGPIQVRIERHAAPGREQELVAAVADLEKLRRRTGALAWTLWRDTADPTRIIEEFLVASWIDHERQHERFTIRDRTRLDDVLSLTDRPPTVEHYLQAL